ncbi:hypothetical protein ACFYNL_35850 [Streptomyces sp. NPDC007808]|uniref:hypothetical protein n=1 Tax=Streptomyces sp. NPDC007808 TaxID=3364779 RepID=UPI0036930894
MEFHVSGDERRPEKASLQLPLQAPPVDRTGTAPSGSAMGAAGIEANGLFDLAMPLISSLFK